MHSKRWRNDFSLLNRFCRLPRFLKASPLRMGDEILEINGVPIVDQDQKEVCIRIVQ